MMAIYQYVAILSVYFGDLFKENTNEVLLKDESSCLSNGGELSNIISSADDRIQKFKEIMSDSFFDPCDEKYLDTGGAGVCVPTSSIVFLIKSGMWKDVQYGFEFLLELPKFLQESTASITCNTFSTYLQGLIRDQFILTVIRNREVEANYTKLSTDLNHLDAQYLEEIRRVVPDTGFSKANYLSLIDLMMGNRLPAPHKTYSFDDFFTSPIMSNTLSSQMSDPLNSYNGGTITIGLFKKSVSDTELQTFSAVVNGHMMAFHRCNIGRERLYVICDKVSSVPVCTKINSRENQIKIYTQLYNYRKNYKLKTAQLCINDGGSQEQCVDHVKNNYELYVKVHYYKRSLKRVRETQGT